MFYLFIEKYEQVSFIYIKEFERKKKEKNRRTFNRYFQYEEIDH